MTIEQNRLALIEALSNGFKKRIKKENIKEMEKAETLSLVGTNDGVDVVSLYSTRAIFKPVFEDNYAQISFNVIFKNCSFNEVTNMYEWDGKEFAVDYGFEYNLMLAHISNKKEYDNPNLVLQTFEQNFPDEKKIAICVLDSVFGAMTKNEFRAFGEEAYKDACGSNDGIMINLVTA